METSRRQKRVDQPTIEIPLRVRYYETDQMGVVHHSNYFRYFEIARMEHLRSFGLPYGALEKSGVLLMVVDMQCKCRTPAYFDELLFVKTHIQKITRFRIVNQYEIRKENGSIVSTGKTVLVSVGRDGIPAPLPDAFVTP